MLDFDFDPDMDIDDDASDLDDDDTYESEPKMYAKKFFDRVYARRLFRLRKMQLRNQRLRIRGLNKATTDKAKRLAKISTAIGFVSLIYKFMTDHHQDKLDKEQQREFLEIAKKYGINPQVAQAAVGMTSSQAKNAVGSAVSSMLEGVVNN